MTPSQRQLALTCAGHERPVLGSLGGATYDRCRCLLPSASNLWETALRQQPLATCRAVCRCGRQRTQPDRLRAPMRAAPESASAMSGAIGLRGTHRRRRRRRFVEHEKARRRTGPSFASSPLAGHPAGRGHRRALDGPSMPRSLQNSRRLLSPRQAATPRVATDRPPPRAVCGAEQRRAGGGARSALRDLTRRACLNGANAVRAVSCATRPQTEQRRGLGPQGRAPYSARGGGRAGAARRLARRLETARASALPRRG